VMVIYELVSKGISLKEINVILKLIKEWYLSYD